MSGDPFEVSPLRRLITAHVSERSCVRLARYRHDPRIWVARAFLRKRCGRVYTTRCPRPILLRPAGPRAKKGQQHHSKGRGSYGFPITPRVAAWTYHLLIPPPHAAGECNAEARTSRSRPDSIWGNCQDDRDIIADTQNLSTSFCTFRR